MTRANTLLGRQFVTLEGKDEAELIADMSTDRDTLKSAVDAMNWPGWNTDTAAGLFSGFF